MPLFAIGMYYGYLSSKERQISVYGYLISLLFVFIALFLVHRINGTLVYGYHILALRLIQITIVCLILNYFKERDFLTKTISVLNWISKYTLEIYLFHLLLYSSLATIWPDVSTIVFMVLSITVSLVICKPVKQIIAKVAN